MPPQQNNALQRIYRRQTDTSCGVSPSHSFNSFAFQTLGSLFSSGVSLAVGEGRSLVGSQNWGALACREHFDLDDSVWVSSLGSWDCCFLVAVVLQSSTMKRSQPLAPAWWLTAMSKRFASNTVPTESRKSNSSAPRKRTLSSGMFPARLSRRDSNWRRRRVAPSFSSANRNSRVSGALS